MTKNTIVLCILDGWGYSEEKKCNAIYLANTPTWDRFLLSYPNSLLKSSGKSVGLPIGQMGNSEIGHLTIGSGRVTEQTLSIINNSIKKNTIFSNQYLREFINKLKSSKGKCHLLGLLSPGGVHSHQNHIYKLVEILVKENIDVIMHFFLDGRDSPPKSSEIYLSRFVSKFKDVKIGTISGRYYAMDRDNHWDRTKLAYDAIIRGEGEFADNPLDLIANNYNKNVTDEFILPTIIKGFSGVLSNDGLLIANFRSDRIKQLLCSIIDPTFNIFKRKSIEFSSAIGMINYSDKLSVFMSSIFEIEKTSNVLAEVLSNNGLKQLHIAETEKYAHVTFFFNGGYEEPFFHEDRLLIPSPNVATYDLKPEMSAFGITERVIKTIEEGVYDFIVINYANPDMVGHTGNIEPAKNAIEAIDYCLLKLELSVVRNDGVLLITADHGNIESMFDKNTGKKNTFHTCNPVPCVLINSIYKKISKGTISDVAPTILEMLNITKPTEMSGVSLLSKN